MKMPIHWRLPNRLNVHRSPVGVSEPSPEDAERLSWVWLSCLPLVRALPKQKLLELAGAPNTLMTLGKSGLEALGIRSPETQSLLLSQKYRDLAEMVVEQAVKAGLGMLYPTHPHYPPSLLQIADKPALLYWQGKCLPWLHAVAPSVAVVGSRRATGYGITMASRLSAALAGLGYPVISGLARGIDTAAHSGALQAEGQTIAVLGNGLDADLAGIYPPDNRKLAERVMATGCLITEYRPGLPPAAYHFPMRNRIISGLSKGVIVIEAGLKSGSLITVGTALEQNRDVMAVPGNATSICSQGCNQLIREGAMLVQSVDDVLEALQGVQPGKTDGMMETAVRTAQDIAGRATGEFGGKRPGRSHGHAGTGKRSPVVETMTIPERIVYERLRREVLTADELLTQTGLSVPELHQVLLQLELSAVITQGMDGRFMPIS